MNRRSLWLLLGCLGCSSSGAFERVEIPEPLVAAEGKPVEPRQYFETGDTFLREELEARGIEDVWNTLEQAGASVLRVTAYMQRPDWSVDARSAIGLCLGNEGRVLVVSRLLSGIEKASFRVEDQEGERWEARAVYWDFESMAPWGLGWAILNAEGLSSPEVSLHIGPPPEDGVFMIADRRDYETVFGPIPADSGPFFSLLDVKGSSSWTWGPRAGCVPVEGLEGAPLFNTHGELVGFLGSVDREARPRYEGKAVPLGAIEDKLVRIQVR